MQCELGSARDHHWIQKGRKESPRHRAGLHCFVLVSHLLSHFGEPVSGALVTSCGELRREFRFQQFLWIIDIGQTAEELYATGEPGQFQTTDWFQQDSFRQVPDNFHTQRAQFGDCEPNFKSTLLSDCQTTFHTEEEHAVCHRSGCIKTADDIAGIVQLQDAAQQPGRNLAAKQISLHRHRH